jgi:hypothetical protein
MAEYRRRIDISRGLAREQERRRQLDRLADLERQKENDAAKVLTVADKTLVHVKAEQSPVGSRDLGGWAWTIYLPPDRRDWWLYISHGTKWDASEGKYVDGAVSGAQLIATGEQTVYGCIVRDQEGGGYINMWSADGCQTARLPDAGHAAFSVGADEVREVTGDAEQVVLPPDTSPKCRMQLLRWHRVRIEDEAAIPANAVREYGFSIFLVDEKRGPRPRLRRPVAP